MERDEAIYAVVVKMVGEMKAAGGYREPSVQPFQLAGLSRNSFYQSSANPNAPFPDLSENQVRASLQRLTALGRLATYIGSYGKMRHWTTVECFAEREAAIKAKAEAFEAHQRRCQDLAERSKRITGQPVISKGYRGWDWNIDALEALVEAAEKAMVDR